MGRGDGLSRPESVLPKEARGSSRASSALLGASRATLAALSLRAVVSAPSAKASCRLDAIGEAWRASRHASRVISALPYARMWHRRPRLCNVLHDFAMEARGCRRAIGDAWRVSRHAGRVDIPCRSMQRFARFCNGFAPPGASGRWDAIGVAWRATRHASRIAVPLARRRMRASGRGAYAHVHSAFAVPFFLASSHLFLSRILLFRAETMFIRAWCSSSRRLRPSSSSVAS